MGITLAERGRAIWICLLIMMASVLFSRAILSMSMILFLVLTLVHKDFGKQLRKFISTPLLWSMSLLFFVPFISGAWSQDFKEWGNIMQIKLPLFLFPLAFAGDWKLTSGQWKTTAYALLIFLFAGCCWSLFQYFTQAEIINENYLRAKVIPTPLYNDHVRYSLMVCFGAILSVLLLMERKDKRERIPLLAALLFFSIYLHIVSARTGLFSLYIFFFILLIYFIFYKKTKASIPILIGAITLPMAAWFLFPTFRNRIKYNLYDFSFIRQDAYLPGANDGNRYHSLKAGWDILKNHPFGVGAGDVRAEVDAWYSTKMPQILSSDKLYPSSEWLVYGDMSGWPGLLLFTICMLIPIFQKSLRLRVIWISLNIIAALSFLLDIGLEVQFGVFLYAFFILWWWKWLGAETGDKAYEL